MTNKDVLLAYARKLGTVTCISATKYIYRGVRIHIRDMGDLTAIYTSDRQSYKMPHSDAELIAMFNAMLDEIDARKQKSAHVECLMDKAETMLRAAGNLASEPTRNGKRRISFNGRKGVLIARNMGGPIRVVAHMPLEMSIRELAGI